nr:helix-turn-helix transcriptional regulator [uncultured Neokomagataea sp.]
MKILTVAETQTVLAENGLDRVQANSFAIKKSTEAIFYDWHTHPYHQITYARKGTTQVEGPEGRHLLPAGHAIWIPPHTRHRTMIRNLDGISLFFNPIEFPGVYSEIRTFVVTSLLREMFLHALHLSDGASDSSIVVQSFFQTFVLLCKEQIENTARCPFILPRAMHPALQRAMDGALNDLGQTSQSCALAHAGMSERSFRRYFIKETGMTWQEWITQARLFHAATLLAEGGRVTDVSVEVGYASLSAFAKAFTALTGVRPGRFRHQSL